MNPARILIAEDESLVAEELRDRMERVGLTVTAVVNSGEDAIARAEETSPDLALIDVQLKGRVDGIAAALVIRERFDIPVVYLAELSDDATVERAQQTSPLGYLLKPVAEKQLQIAVRMALQYHEMQLGQHRKMDLPQRVEAVGAADSASRQGFVLARHSPKPSDGWSDVRPLSLVKPSPPQAAIQEQLHRILSSQTLAQSKRLVRFLSFVVEKALEEEGSQLNEYLIGVEVYQRPSSFDSHIDTIVRTEARRLRSKLKQYYEREGINDPILIEVPKGSYVPAFRERERGILNKDPGQLIAHYRLLEKLGEGGMGTVYLAEDTRLNRQVALKFIHDSQLKEKHARERLFREARAAAAIDHPNVAAVYEVGEVDGHPYIAMAHVEGQNLEERILERPFKIQEGLHVACQLADALEAAHRKGVIHRDLNPTNVILGEQGRLRIVDFGLAKLSYSSLLTDPGMLVGTASYVSPEQMRGEAVDHRTDIWSLGVILHEVLTGKRPFEAEHRDEVYYAIAHKAPEPLNHWRAGIPKELSRIVLKCLEKEPANRYSDVAALKEDLSKVRPYVAQAQDSVSTTRLLPAEGTQEPVVKSDSSVRLESLAPTSGESRQMPRETTASETESSDTGKKDQLSRVARLGSPLPFLGRTAAWIVAATFAVFLVLAGSVWWVRTAQRQRPREDLVAAPSIPRLVVLPFESRTSGEENQSLSYAISDSLISRLSKLRGLEVASPTTIVRLTERKATLPEIAKILNVQYALEGSLLRSGHQGHVTAQLIRLSDDSHVWSQEFDFPWRDLFAVRQKLSESVVRQMKIQLLPEEQQLLARNSTQSSEAYQAYAKGRYSLVRFSYLREPGYLTEAEKHFKRALEEDSQYANALADLAYLCYQRFYLPQGDRKELATQGIGYAKQALAIDPNHVEALYILGSLYDHIGQADKGLELCQKAVQLEPNNPEAHQHLAWRYLERGFYESGIAENNVALAKDTLFMDSYYYKIQFLIRLGRYEEALATVNQLEEVEPSSPYPRLLRADAAFFQGDLARAESGWREAMKMNSKRLPLSDVIPVLLATISARKGEIEQARQVLHNFDTTRSRLTDYPIKLAALVGEKDLAIDLIRNSSINRNYRWLVSDPDIASLHNEPRFQELLAELYQKWQRDLDQLGQSLPVRPPKLPTPEEYLSHPAR